MSVAGIVGGGVIGRSWALLFARAGWEVRLFDADVGVRESVTRRIAEDLARIDESSPDVLSRIAVVDSLEVAVATANYVQESVAEQVESKRRIAALVDQQAPADTIIASSASALLPDEIFGGLPGEARMIIAHPFNPPHLIPVVELVAASRTEEATLDRTKAILRGLGQHPVMVAIPIAGYIGNRLQVALVAEAMQLVAEGAATPDDIDTVLRIGLGRRWSFMGPFETMDLNADGGIAEYIGRFGSSYQGLAAQLRLAEPWLDSTIGAVVSARRAALPLEALPERAAARDRRLWSMRASDSEDR